jgi:hypothetical protein
MTAAFLISAAAENVGAWSTFVLAWLGVLAFFGALLGVAQTRQDGKRARTLDYLRRLYSQEFGPMNAQVMAFVRTGDTDMLTPGTRLDQNVTADPEAVEAAFYRLDIESQSRVNLVLNFYEELSCSYREGLLDKEVAEKMLLPAVETMWDQAEPLIRQFRTSVQKLLDTKKPNDPPESVKPDELMEEWEEVVKALREKRDEEETEPKVAKSRASLKKAQRVLRFDGPAVRWAGLLAAVLVAVGLLVIGVAAATGAGGDAPARGTQHHATTPMGPPASSPRSAAPGRPLGALRSPAGRRAGSRTG